MNMNERKKSEIKNSWVGTRCTIKCVFGEKTRKAYRKMVFKKSQIMIFFVALL